MKGWILHEWSKKGEKRTMKKVALFFMIMVIGALVYIMSFTTDGTSSSQIISSTIIPLVIIYGFFGIVLLIIGKKGHDYLLHR
jgi:drug/metabolite transporter (DMT)-like permease